MVIGRLMAVVTGLLVAGLASATLTTLTSTEPSSVTRVAAAGKVTVSCVAVKATHEGRDERYIDRDIRALEEVVVEKDSRRYDTYRFLWRGNATMAYEEESSLRISERYTLYVTPLSQDRQGRIRVAVRVEEQPDPKARRSRNDEEAPKPVVAVRATSLLVPGNHLKLDGLNLDEGKMIIVLTVRPG
jgi:hypothetical protein